MDKNSKIFVTGSGGMVGRTLVSMLQQEGYINLLLTKSDDLDLRNQIKVDEFFSREKPDYIIHLAARVGGIVANMTNPIEFLMDNMRIGMNVINTSFKYNVKKLLNLGSSCIYPRDCRQPMKEEYLLSGKLEPTNEGYALAKIAALKLCEYYFTQHGCNFISLMPPNLYGINDHFDEKNSHVLSALISRFHKAKIDHLEEVVVWGTGSPRREFLYDEDLSKAIIYFMKNYDAKDLQPFINVGSGEDISIRDLAFLIRDLTNYQGKVVFDVTKPDGMPKKLLDNSRANTLGWKAKTSIGEGIKKTIEFYCRH